MNPANVKQIISIHIILLKMIFNYLELFGNHFEWN